MSSPILNCRQEGLLEHAQAALRDYQYYQGRAADREANAQRLIDMIAQALAGLNH